MSHSPFDDPALTVALALAAGMLAQSVARHLRIPGIVLLLATGVLLGPDLLGIIRPASLGSSLHTLVGFAVAIILFEGGLNMNVQRLRREGRTIRQLVTLGALVTAAGGTLTARWILGWSWPLSALFGTLVMVTGPTVINPLLRRIKVKTRIATVLEAEGVLVDAIGAIVAVVALEVTISPGGPALAFGGWNVVTRLGFGALAGAAGGFVLAWLLRREQIVPEGFEGAFTLAAAAALFEGSNAVLPETGIVSVVVAGLVVGNSDVQVVGELREFKEKLTVLLIGLLFVLLAADVRLADVAALGWPALGAVAALMLVVRPLNVLAGTLGSDLDWREKTFLAWLAPRGIVAAAVSSLFAQTLQEAGIPGGTALRALVFLVIAATVVIQGLSGGLVAGLLGVRRPANTGYAILGANDLARTLAQALRGAGEEVILIDSNPDACHRAEEEGFRVLYGSGLDESIQLRAGLDSKAGCLGLTSNDAINLLFARRSLKDYHVPRVWVALRRGHVSVDDEIVHRHGGYVLFGSPQPLDLWAHRLEQRLAVVKSWRATGPTEPPEDPRVPGEKNSLLPLALLRGHKMVPMDETVSYRQDDVLVAAVLDARRAAVDDALQSLGWAPEPAERAALLA